MLTIKLVWNSSRPCKVNCDKFIILLHSDPSIERPKKLKPVLSVKERKEMLLCFKQIDQVYQYTYESELYDLIKFWKPDVRILVKIILVKIHLLVMIYHRRLCTQLGHMVGLLLN